MVAPAWWSGGSLHAIPKAWLRCWLSVSCRCLVAVAIGLLRGHRYTGTCCQHQLRCACKQTHVNQNNHLKKIWKKMHRVDATLCLKVPGPCYKYTYTATWRQGSCERMTWLSEDCYHKQWVVSLWPAPLLSLWTQRILVYLPARQRTKKMHWERPQWSITS